MSRGNFGGVGDVRVKVGPCLFGLKVAVQFLTEMK
jgi:hypothetical protein